MKKGIAQRKVTKNREEVLLRLKSGKAKKNGIPGSGKNRNKKGTGIFPRAF